MKKSVFILFFLLCLFHSSMAQLNVGHLRVENLINPTGIDVLRPTFSWQFSSNESNVVQSAYEIKVASDSKSLSDGKVFWKSGKVNSDQSVYVPFNGQMLVSNQRYYWQVRVWDNKGNVSEWSTVSYWQMGFLNHSDWKAEWIMPGYKEEDAHPSPLMRKEFDSHKKIRYATAYITAHGLYEAQINGKRVGDAYLTPGFTSYNKRLQYQAYDVTDFLKDGANAIGVTLSDGWYRGTCTFNNDKNVFGTDIALLFQLEIIYADGTTATIFSDGTWKSNTGSIRSSSNYDGEFSDARLKKEGWSTAGYNDRDWSSVKTANFSKEVLVATYNEVVRRHEVIKPVKIFKTPRGEQVLDFGQNLVGWVQFKVKGKEGDKITISHAEVLDKSGNFYTENLRRAKAQDIYILSSNSDDTLEPHFSWHGFRYAKVEGYKGELSPDNFAAIVIYSDMDKTGFFNCSNKLLNQLQSNIEWGLRGNFLDIPTDCPQRNERLGWTGDAQVFFRTATFLRGVNNFFTKWLKDLSADQLPDGRVPHVIPQALGAWGKGGSAGWSDAATIIPWGMYQVYGDKRILESQYQSMKLWVDFIKKQCTGDLWNKGNHFGDWLFYSVNDDRDGQSAITDKHLIAQCFYAYSTQLLINAAKELGKKEDVSYYTSLLQKIKDAFINEYTTRNGATMSNTQTSYVLALQFDMFPEPLRQQAADRLVANIKQFKNHLTTGFLGTPYLCHVLSRYGYSDVAYSLLLQESYPSWLYPVTKGATTIWERWDGIRPNGDFQTTSMNSFNHYAYGAIGDWMYRVMVGIDVEEGSIGYKKISIHPHIGGNLTYANASYETPYGKLFSGWKLEDKKLLLNAEIPTNTSAIIYIPIVNNGEVTVNGQPLLSSKSVIVADKTKEYVSVRVGSGKYEFSTPSK